MNKPIDFSAREKALDVEKSLVVTAPAGSGKTGLLTFRILKLLARVSQPEEILAITFTKKAAHEMRERILIALKKGQAFFGELDQEQALIKISHVESPFERQELELVWYAQFNAMKRGWHLTENTHRLKIKTIDSFCRELATSMPIASGIDSSIGIATNANHLYDDAIRAFFDEYAKGEFVELTNRLLLHFDGNIDKLKNQLVSMLATRDQWLPLVSQAKNSHTPLKEILIDSLEEIACEKTNELAHLLSPISHDLFELLRYSANNLSETDPSHNIAKLADVNTFPEPGLGAITDFFKPLCQALTTDSDTFRKTADKRIGFPADDKVTKQRFVALLKELESTEGLLEVVIGVKKLPAKGYSLDQLEIMESLLTLLPICVVFLNWVFQSQREVDFSEMMFSALQSLSTADEDPTDLALILDYKLNHILIDEFQDTSYAQLQLLELLTHNWQPNDGKTLFVVGDAMQSCYRFRNANVGLFLNIKDKGLSHVNMEAANLSVNFRSCPAIVEWVNVVFSSAFPSVDDINRGAVSFEQSHAFENFQSFGAADSAPNNVQAITCEAQVYHEEKDKELINPCEFIAKATARLNLFTRIAKQITSVNAADANASIAIIARTKSHLAGIIQVLKQHQIAYRAVEIELLVRRPEIIDLISLCQWLNDISSQNFWLAMLRAPWCALSLEELTLLTSDRLVKTSEPAQPLYIRLQNQTLIQTLSEESQFRINRLLQVHIDARNKLRRVPFSQLVEQCWYAIGAPYSLSEPAQMENIETFFTMLRQHESGGIVADWSRFEDAIERLFASTATPANPSPPVELMTMHKSKGLEFDHVFLIGLDGTTQSDTSGLLDWLQHIDMKNIQHTVLSPLKSHTDEKHSELASYIGYQRKIRAQHEEVRLLYVACTRAKSHLYLNTLIKEKLNKKKNELEVSPPAANSILGALWAHVESAFSLNRSLSAEPLDKSSLSKEHLTAKIKSESLSDTSIYSCLSPQGNAGDIDTFAVNPQNLEAQSSGEFDNQGASLLSLSDELNDVSAIGTVFHRILHQVGLDGMSHWPDQRLRDAREHWTQILIFAGLTQTHAAEAYSDICLTLSLLRNNEQFQWILDSTHQFSRFEWEVIVGDPPKKLIIDRLFIDGDTAWIIDYKTSRAQHPKELNTFLANQEEQYKQQLDRYAEAIAPLLPANVKIKTGLYFLHHQTLHTVKID